MGNAAVVLIVDDHPDFRWLMTHVLGDAGFSCHEACCAEEALERLCSDLKPDVVVTDLHMRQMSGRDLLAQIRSNALLVEIPVLLVTNDVHIETVAREAGFDSFLDKPHLGSELVGKVHTLLRDRRGA